MWHGVTTAGGTGGQTLRATVRVYDGEPEKHVFMPGRRPFIHEKQTTDRSHGEDRIGATPLQRASRIQRVYVRRPAKEMRFPGGEAAIPIHLLIRAWIRSLHATRREASLDNGYDRRPSAACVPCSNNERNKKGRFKADKSTARIAHTKFVSHIQVPEYVRLTPLLFPTEAKW
jgi:hypothetical protein